MRYVKPYFGKVLRYLSPFLWLLYIELLNGWTLPKLFHYWFSGEADWFILVFHAYGFLLLCGVFFILCRLLGDRIGSITAATIAAVFGITNFCVLSITGQPFVFSDLKIAGTAFSVLSVQSLSKGEVLTLTCAVLFWLGYCVAVWLMTAKQVYEAKQYLLRLVPAILAANLMYFGVLFSADLADVVLLFDGHHKYGAIAHFVISGGVGLDFPEDVEQYLLQKDTDTISDFKPNVIIVMNEAFSDIQKTFHLESNIDAIPFFHQLCEKYPHGISYSSVRGNNTCSTEFELLSGVSTALTAKGAIIYESNAVPMQTLVSAMNARGYETVGIHPYYRTGYNREAVYEALGFDKTYFMDDFEDAEFIHGFISDKSGYEMLIAQYESASAPFFCFNVTMQNHAGYGDDGNLPDKVMAKTNSDAGDALNNYLTLLHESDKALEYLISYFDTVEEPTVILFVGDHQPMLGKSFYEEQIGKLLDDFSVEDVSRMYEVPYLIWANFLLNSECIPAETSMNYLQDILFETAGIAKTPWMEQLAEYRREYPIVTSNFMRQGKGGIVSLSVSDKLTEYKKYLLWNLVGRRKTVMQEEISNQIVIILKNTGRLTAQALKHAIIKAVIEPEQKRAALQRSKQTAAENEKVRQKMRQKERKQNQKNRPHGRMKVKELVAQGKGVKSFEISSDSKSKFITNANKMGVDFAVETAENGNTMVFYKPGDVEVVTAIQQHTMGKAWSKSAPENEVLSGIGIGMNDFKRVKKAFDEAKIPCHGVREQNSIMLLYPREHDDAVLKIMEKHYTAQRENIGDVTKDAVLERIPVNGDNIGDFTQIARRYKVEFTPYKVQNEDKYLVFFRSEKREQIHAAFRAYTKDMRRREHDKTDQRVPLEVRLRHSHKIMKEQNKQKLKNKERKLPER